MGMLSRITLLVCSSAFDCGVDLRLKCSPAELRRRGYQDGIAGQMKAFRRGKLRRVGNGDSISLGRFTDCSSLRDPPREIPSWQLLREP
jgi:hypothetical protein